MTKEEWINHRNNNNFNLQVLKKSCELDKKCKLKDNEIENYFNLILKHPFSRGVIQNSYNNIKKVLDNYYELHIIIDKNNNEIRIL